MPVGPLVALDWMLYCFVMCSSVAHPNRPVNVASGAGIVYTGGGQTRSTTLADQLHSMRATTTAEASGADFIFDVKFLRANTEVGF